MIVSVVRNPVFDRARATVRHTAKPGSEECGMTNRWGMLQRTGYEEIRTCLEGFQVKLERFSACREDAPHKAMLSHTAQGARI